MDWLLHVDWKEAFVPTMSVAEIFIRGTIIYLLLFAFMRVLRREAGGIGITDLLVVVIIADAAQNAMAGEYKSITEGVLLILTIGFWDYTLDWLGFSSPRFQRLLRPSPLLLVKDGRMQRRNMKQEMITEQELISQLREHGVEDVKEVKLSYLEGDGRISVIERETKSKKKGGQGDADGGGTRPGG
jgi:uncharacterized membrane protein YcaP (DUF421 family)